MKSLNDLWSEDVKPKKSSSSRSWPQNYKKIEHVYI